MSYFSSVSLLLATTRLCLVDGVTKSKFQRVESLSDKVCPPSRRVFEAQARSLASCVTMATQLGCLGVSYRHEDKACYGSDTAVDSAGQFEPLAGAVFYRRLTAIPNGYVNLSGYILKFVDSPELAYDAASDACADSGGQLVKIDTPEMNAAIQSFLLEPENGHTSVYYWIQLREVAGSWQFADGSSPADLGSKWAPGEPTILTNDCGLLWAGAEFMWADWGCTNLLGYICELIE